MADEKQRSIGRRMEDVTLRNVLGEIRSLAEMVSRLGEKAIKMDEKLDRIMSAFPDGEDGVDGMVAHRIYHIKANKEAESSERLKGALIEKLSAAGVLGVLAIVGAALLLYAQMKFGSKGG